MQPNGRLENKLQAVMEEPKFLYPLSISGNTVTLPRTRLLILLLVSSFVILRHGVELEAADGYKHINIGAIIDNANSRIGIEQRVAMQIAVENSNSVLKNYKLALYFRHPDRDLLNVSIAAESLIKEHEVKVIIGWESWGEAALLAEIGRRAQVPVLSFAEPPISTPLTVDRWPLLVTMTNNKAEQIRCAAALVGSYNWRKVIVIYEDDAIGADTRDLVNYLSGALRNVSSEIEQQLVLPPFSYLTNPKEYVQKELEKLQQTQSRVFIVLQLSSSTTIHLFREARKMGFMGADSVWITTETIASLLDSYNTSVISSMAGVLGIKTYFSEDTTSYQDFKAQFKTKFRYENLEEDNSDPGIYALKAHDSIKTVALSLEKVTSDDGFSSAVLLEKILSSNFTGLSGEISFEGARLRHTAASRLIKVVGKKYKELEFWLPEFGFSKTLEIENGSKENNSSSKVGDGAVTWPGDLKPDIPKGWAMPTEAKPLIIGVPGRTSFDKFVKVSLDNNHYEGFCIDLFREVLKVLDYALPYKFVSYNGSYDDLVEYVHNRSFDAVVGDITILLERAKNMEFTVPYAESGLSMIVQLQTEESAWMFIKPFTKEMWAVTGGILIYTMCMVWILEHPYNPEFRGPWRNQIATALWFTSSSLFFAHRERVHSNLTRLVVVVWLFVVLILNSSYTASLSSMLTVRRMKPDLTDIEWLKRANLKVGCDGDSFVRKYLQNVTGFKSENILNVSYEYDYPKFFQNNAIAAAFLELPYEKVFMGQFCKNYTATIPSTRFGGLAFAFQKGSPIAADFSEAILQLSENGVLKKLEESWFASSRECSTNLSNDETESLELSSFWGLYLISGATSTLCALPFLVKLLKKYRQNQAASQGNIALSELSFWIKVVRFAKYSPNNSSGTNNPGTAAGISALALAQTPDVYESSSGRWEYQSSSGTPSNLQTTSQVDFETEDIPLGG